jgi:hypothetical protein
MHVKAQTGISWLMDCTVSPCPPVTPCVFLLWSSRSRKTPGADKCGVVFSPKEKVKTRENGTKQ